MNNPLNSKDISGNTLNIGIDDEIDYYHCPKCECDVVEEEFNHKRGICYDCFWHINSGV